MMSGLNRAVLLGLCLVSGPAGGATGATPSSDPVSEAASRFEQAHAAQARGDHAAALPHFEAAARLAPTWGLALLGLARCREALELEAAATLEALERASELAPRNPAAWRLFATVLEGQGAKEPAAAAWREVAALVPADGHAHTRAGALALETGDLVNARSHLRIASGLDPDAVVGRTLLVEALERSGLMDEAVRELQGYVRSHPDNPYVWRRLAGLLERHGDAAGAKRAERTAERLAKSRAVPKRRMRRLGPVLKR